MSTADSLHVVRQWLRMTLLMSSGYGSYVYIRDLFIPSRFIVGVSHWIKSSHMNKIQSESTNFLNFWPIQSIHPYIHVQPSTNI